jgi:RNA polymerase sigma-70 factor (ECF subfamily)
MIQSDLITACRANNRKAQMELYRKYSQGMYAVSRRYIQDPDDAEDMVQEAFIKAFQKLDQFRGDVSFGAWLKRIVVNRCIDFLKSQKERLIELQDHHIHVVEDEDWTVEDGISADDVIQAMNELTDKYKDVVQLYLVEGYDHGEISEILGITQTNCRSRLLRGKGHLKKIINEKYYGTGS